MTEKVVKRGRVGDRAEFFALNMSPVHPSQARLRKITMEHPLCEMLGATDSIMLLTNMLRFAGAKKCLDVGVYTGYSSLSWALNIPDDGKVVACDVSTEFAAIGIPIWKEAGVDHKIDLRIAPAGETLQSLLDNGEAGTYDFMFIDADKTGYDAYYELGLKLIRKNGIIAIDNCWWNGVILDPTANDPKTVALRELNAKIRSDSRVTAVLNDSGDGVYICLVN